MSLGRWAARRPVLVAVIFLVLAIAGGYGLRQMPLDVFPKIELPTLTVVVVYPGASASDIEDRVNEPIEDALGGLAGIDQLLSSATDNLGTVTCVFDFDTDLDQAAADIRERLSLVRRKLPEGIDEPAILKFDTGMMPVMVLAVTADVGSVDDWYETVRLQVKERLQRLEGVGSVSVLNPSPEEVHVDIDRARLEQYGLTLLQATQAIQAQNLSFPMGNLAVGGMDYAVRLPGELATLDELRDLVVGAGTTGGIVRLRDVARVSVGPPERDAVSKVNDREALILTVQKQSDANTVEVATRVQEEVEQLNGTLPHGLRIVEVMDTSRFVRRMVSALSEAVAYGGAFVVLVVFLFLRRLRASIIVGLAIPASMLIAFAALHAGGRSLNIISLLALAVSVGMVVDNAIVVLENITRHLQEGKSPEDAAAEGLREVGAAVAASTTTTVVVFAPMLLLGGVMGVFAADLSIVVISAVSASLFASLLLTPMLAANLLRSVEDEKRRRRTVVGRALGALYDLSERAWNGFERLYARAVGFAVRWKSLVLLAAFGTVGATVWIVLDTGMNFMDRADSGEITVTGNLPVGTSTERTVAVAEEVEAALREIAGPDLEMAYRQAGRSEEGQGAMMGMTEGTHVFTIGARLCPQLERTRGTSLEMAAALRERMDRIPDLVNYQIRTQATAMSMTMGGSKPIQVEVHGRDLAEMRAVLEQVREIVASTPGATELVVDGFDTRPELQVTLDRLRASMLGLNAYTAGLALRTALHGGEAGVYRGEGIRAEEVPLVVRLRREDRDEMADVGRFALPSVTGASVRLSNVGSLVEAEAPVEIRRKNRERIMTVSANAEGRPLSDIAADIDARLAELELPEGVAVEFGGDVEQQREVMGEVRIALLFSILLVYMVMAGQYGTLRDPLVVMFSVPFAFTGVFLGVRAVGMTFSLINFLGLIMLMGIVVNNAIVLVDYVNLLRREQAMPVLRAVVETGRRRLRPVLITAMTTMFGMLPMALAKGEGHAIWQPIGVSMIGGLLVSTVVTLFLVPVVYTIFHWPAVRRERRAAATAAAAAPDAGVPTPDPPAEGP